MNKMVSEIHVMHTCDEEYTPNEHAEHERQSVMAGIVYIWMDMDSSEWFYGFTLLVNMRNEWTIVLCAQHTDGVIIVARALAGGRTLK